MFFSGDIGINDKWQMYVFLSCLAFSIVTIIMSIAIALIRSASNNEKGNRILEVYAPICMYAQAIFFCSMTLIIALWARGFENGGLLGYLGTVYQGFKEALLFYAMAIGSAAIIKWQKRKAQCG